MSNLRVVVIDKDPEVRDFVALVLDNYYDIETVHAASHEEADKICDSDDKIALIVRASNSADHRSANKSKIKSVQVDKMRILVSLKSEIENFFHVSPIPTPESAGRFVRIRISTLQRTELSDCDVYHRIAGERYAALPKTGGMIQPEQLTLYLNLGTEHLYVREADCNMLIDRLARDLAYASKMEYAPATQVRLLARETQELLSQFGRKLGFDPTVLNLAQTAVELVLKMVAESPGLRDVFSDFHIETGNYLSEHSLLAGYMGCAIAHELGFNSEAVRVNLVFAGIAHDILLTDVELASCETPGDVLLKISSGGLTTENLNDFLKHPEKTARRIENIPEIPADVAVIVHQHHETPDGKGFPSGLRGDQIGPLSRIFIIAHDLARFGLDIGQGEPRVPYFFASRGPKYANGAFQEAFQALKASFEHRS